MLNSIHLPNPWHVYELEARNMTTPLRASVEGDASRVEFPEISHGFLCIGYLQAPVHADRSGPSSGDTWRQILRRPLHRNRWWLIRSGMWINSWMHWLETQTTARWSKPFAPRTSRWSSKRSRCFPSRCPSPISRYTEERSASPPRPVSLSHPWAKLSLWSCSAATATKSLLAGILHLILPSFPPHFHLLSTSSSCIFIFKFFWLDRPLRMTTFFFVCLGYLWRWRAARAIYRPRPEPHTETPNHHPLLPTFPPSHLPHWLIVMLIMM